MVIPNGTWYHGKQFFKTKTLVDFYTCASPWGWGVPQISALGLQQGITLHKILCHQSQLRGLFMKLRSLRMSFARNRNS